MESSLASLVKLEKSGEFGVVALVMRARGALTGEPVQQKHSALLLMSPHFYSNELFLSTGLARHKLQ